MLSFIEKKQKQNKTNKTKNKKKTEKKYHELSSKCLWMISFQLNKTIWTKKGLTNMTLKAVYFINVQDLISIFLLVYIPEGLLYLKKKVPRNLVTYIKSFI